MLICINFLQLNAVEFKCTWRTVWGQKSSCVLNHRTPIRPDLGQDHINFSGLSNAQRNQVTELVIKTWNISTIPVEFYETFPNLTEITFDEFKMETLSFEWLERITNSFIPVIRKLGLHLKITKMDPRVAEIFKKFDRIFLYRNICIYDSILKTNWNTGLNDKKLKKCFKNFVGDFVFEKLENLTKKLSVSDLKIEELTTNLYFSKVENDVLKSNITHLEDLIGGLKENLTSTISHSEVLSLNQSDTEIYFGRVVIVLIGLIVILLAIACVVLLKKIF